MSVVRKTNLSKFDEVFTPEWAIEAFIKTASNMGLLDKVYTVWCPADTGKSNIVTTLRRYKFDAMATHIHDGYDFLKTYKKCDMIITNPPYTIKNDFLKRAFELKIPFAFLLPIDSLSSLGRVEMYTKNDVGFLVHAKRIDFTGNKRPHFYNVWVLGNCGFNNKIHWIV